MAIAVKILRQGEKVTDNKLIVTAGSADTGQIKVQYNGTDIYDNLSGVTADVLSGASNTNIYLPLDSNSEIEKGVYRIIFQASAGTSDDQQISFNINPLDPIINQEVDIYSPYIRLDDNTNYTPANSTVTSSTRTFTLKYPAGSNQSNLVSTTTDIEYDLYITTTNVWTGSSQATVNYDVTYTITGVPYAGGNYLDFTYQEIGSGYEPIKVDEENTLCDLYDNINLLREKVYAANISRRGDYATLLSNYQYVGALMSQFREAITCDKTAAAEDILSQIKYIVGAGVPPNATSKASRRVYGASSQITMTISDASLEVQNVDNIIFSGATLTDNGDGQVTVTIENAPTLTVTDGTTTVTSVDNITVSGATVTDDGSGDVTLTIDTPPSTFEADITVALSGGKTLGKYENGDTIPSTGKTFEEVINLIAQETINPTFVNPSFSTTLSPSQTYEVGTAYTGTFTGTLDRGKILGDIVAGVWNPTALQDYRSGAAIEYTLDGTTQVSNSLSVARTLVNGSNTFNASVNYAEGPQPLDSTGSAYSTPLAAGSLSSNKTITARYKQFWGAVAAQPANSTEVRALPSSNFENTNTFTLVTGTTYNRFVVAIRATKSITSVIDTGNLNANITGSYVLVNASFTVNDAGGNPVTYKLYEMVAGIPYSTSTNHLITTA